MVANLFPLVSFVLITTFTPGPSNISSASMGVLHGYKQALNYLAGLTAGFLLVMSLSGLVSATLLNLFPILEPIFRYVGAAYILYLAFGILKASYTFTETDTKPLGFIHGFMLQVLNPKMIIFAFTLFSTFLAPITGNVVLILVALVLLTIDAFCAMSVWALFGTVIKTYLHYPRVNTAVNIILSLLLVYSAIELAGIV